MAPLVLSVYLKDMSPLCTMCTTQVAGAQQQNAKVARFTLWHRRNFMRV